MSDSSQPRSGYINEHGLRLHYVARGNPDAPSVLLIHGMRDHARSWDWIAERLADHYHVIAPDLRGHGDSDWVEPRAYTLPAFVLDLADVADSLALSPIALVGHSLGGAIAVRYAGIFPDKVRALCTIEGIELPIVRDQRLNPTTYPLRMRAWVEAERHHRTRAPHTYANLADAEARMTEEQPTLNADTIAHLVRHGVVSTSDDRLQWKFDNAARRRAPEDADGHDLDEILAAVDCPTLLAYGEASWIPVPPPERLALIRDHQLVTFPAASHWLHHQSRDAFLSTLLPFLERSADMQSKTGMSDSKSVNQK
jgi:pimeloyl-ACP methyl ester carboxylesterase